MTEMIGHDQGEQHFAECPYCHREMRTGNGCTIELLHSGRVFRRIKWGEEKRFGSEDEIWRDDPCHDCNVEQGQCHHPGCDMEECPRCGQQLISCDCMYDEFDDVEEDVADE